MMIRGGGGWTVMEKEEVIITIKRDGEKPTLPDGKARTVIFNF